MLLAGFLHGLQLAPLEFVAIDVSPIVAGRIHRKAGCYGAVRADDHIVLPRAAIPFGEVQLAVV